jgi:hypothetical protein
MKDMKYTVYRITNKIDGKTYIGCHKTDNLDDGYMGSGTLLKRAVEKHGIENFHKETLQVFDTSEEMFHMESVLVNEEFAGRKDTYNIKCGGCGGFDYINTKELNKDPETKRSGHRAMLKSLGEDGLRSRQENAGKASVDKKVGIHSPDYEHTYWIGKSHTTETIERMKESHKDKHNGEKNSQYGTIWITNEVESKKIKKDEEIPEGWRRGRKQKLRRVS